MRTAMGLVLVVSMGAVFADEPDPVAAKVDKATDTYKAEMKVYREKATVWLDAREAAARKGGDKKAVDRVHEEQRIFRTVSDLPKAAPEELRARPTDAKAKLVKAYSAAVKEWTKAGKDKEAAAAEKQLAQIRDWLDVSLPRRVWVHDKGGFHMVGKGTWREDTPDGQTVMWTETDRTSAYIELQTTRFDRKHIYQITNASLETKIQPATEFKTACSGKWRE